MSLRQFVLLTVFPTFLLAPFTPDAQGADQQIPNLGLRLATSLDRDATYFEQYEVFAGLPLPFKHQFAGNWRMSSMLDLAVAVIDGDGETNSKASAGIDLTFFSPQKKISVESLLGVGVMSDYQQGEVDFGGPLYIKFLAAINYWFTPNFSAGYGYYHESNGKIYSNNPSLNMHQLSFRVHF